MQALRVIVPCRNEAAALPRLFADLEKQRGIRLRITLADGGSADASVAIAKAAGADVVLSEPGRGRQMNRALQACDEELLLFLHADSQLDDEHLLATALAYWRAQPQPGTAGHFGLRFYDAPRPKTLFYRHMEAKSCLNYPQCFNGDQGLLIQRQFLTALGGFAETLPFLEDQALGQSIRAQGQLITLPGRLGTSARRFEVEGRGERYFAMMVIMCAREAGLWDFLQKAPAFYREQADTTHLDLLPLVEATLQQAAQQAEFWPVMARYTMANAWQPVALLDTALNRQQRWVGAYYRRLHPTMSQSRLLQALLRPILRGLFRRLLPAYLRRQARRRAVCNNSGKV